ncbi:MAG: tetratricopeptide repeat protein [Acidobacteriota bacterium]
MNDRATPHPPPCRRAGWILIALICVVVAAAASGPAVAQTAKAKGADAEVAFAFGVAAYHRGDTEEAVERLSEAAAADPEDGTARYWLGLALLAAGDGARAESELTAARDSQRPPAVTPERLRQDLDRARDLAAGRDASSAAPPAPVLSGFSRFGELPVWELEVRGSWGDDSNPLLVADGVFAFAPDGRVVQGAESDRVTQLGARFDLRPVRSAGGWTLGLAFGANQASFDEFGFLDFTRLAGTAHLAWGGDPAGFLGSPLGATRVPIGHRRFALLLQGGVAEDELDSVAFVTTTRLAASVFWRQGATGTTRLAVATSDEDFENDGSGAFEASGTTTEVEVEQTFYLGPRNRYLRLAAAVGERDAGATFDASHTRGRAELALPLSDRWTLGLSGSYETIDFDAIESNPLFFIFPVDEIREDTKTGFSAVVSWALTPRLLLVGRGSRTDRDADLGPVAEQFFDFDYERTVVTVGFRWFFQPGGAS